MLRAPLWAVTFALLLAHPASAQQDEPSEEPVSQAESKESEPSVVAPIAPKSDGEELEEAGPVPRPAEARRLKAHEVASRQTPSLFGQYFGSFGAALLGATAAFGLAFWRFRKEEREREHVAIRLAHFSVGQYLDRLIALQRSIEPQRGNDDRWLELHISKWPHLPKIDCSGLGFVLKSTDPNLLNKLLFAERRFDDFGSILALYWDLRHQLQSEASQLEVQGPKQLKELILRRPVIVDQLKSFTDQMYKEIGPSIESIRKTLDMVAEFCEKNFPGVRLPSIEVIPKEDRTE